MLCKLAILALVPLALASQNQYLRKSLFDHYDKLVKPDNGVKLDFKPTILSLNLCPRKDVSYYHQSLELNSFKIVLINNYLSLGTHC